MELDFKYLMKGIQHIYTYEQIRELLPTAVLKKLLLAHYVMGIHPER